MLVVISPPIERAEVGSGLTILVAAGSAACTITWTGVLSGGAPGDLISVLPLGSTPGIAVTVFAFGS